MKYQYLIVFGFISMVATTSVNAEPLGLPPLHIPDDNLQTPEKIALGDKLFHDKRFSSTGDVACSTCHAREKAFTDSPLKVSEGINKQTGTRNAPTVVNAAYMKTQFWDGREPDLEGQSAGPFVNPVEMGLKDYQPILEIVRTDPEYQQMFKQVFAKSGDAISMTEVKQAIASFERTVIAGDSPFDQYRYGNDITAMSESAIKGFEVFKGQGRCVSCHMINQNHALFMDNKFHNLGIGFDRVSNDVFEMANAFSKAKAKNIDLDVAVLTNKNTSELGRFVVSNDLQHLGSFKTPSLRNIEKTAPYMHDGSLKSLEDVVDFYNNGGLVKETDPVNDFQSGGIRPLNLSDEQKSDLVEFMKALTSPEYQ